MIETNVSVIITLAAILLSLFVATLLLTDNMPRWFRWLIDGSFFLMLFVVAGTVAVYVLLSF